MPQQRDPATPGIDAIPALWTGGALLLVALIAIYRHVA